MISKNVSNKCYQKNYRAIKKHWYAVSFRKVNRTIRSTLEEIAASFVSKGIPTNPKIPDAMVHGQHGLPKF